MQTKDYQTASHDSQARVLLIVEDPEIAGTMLEFFVYEGIQVDIAENRRRALDLLMSGLHFDLVIANMTIQIMADPLFLNRIYRSRTKLSVITMKGFASPTNGFNPNRKWTLDCMYGILKTQLMKTVHEALKDHN